MIFYFNKKQIDSALKYYQLLQEKNIGYKNTWVLYNISNCFEHIGRVQEAEEYYLKCLQIDATKDSLDWGFPKNLACENLADLYYNHKKYREALTYLGYSKTIYKPKEKLCEAGCWNMFDLDFRYKIANCYFGLNKKDSMVAVLAPLVFRPPDYYECMDSLWYDSVCQFFTATIFDWLG